MARSARVTADRIGALLMQGNALASQTQYRDAIRCYEKILELAPRNLDAINNRVTPREICAGCRGAVPLDVAAVVRSATPGGLSLSPSPDAPRASARGWVFKSASGCLPPRRGAVIIRLPLLHRPRMSTDR
jgi:tetratricopeptide (TPR) repeat protein